VERPVDVRPPFVAHPQASVATAPGHPSPDHPAVAVGGRDGVDYLFDVNMKPNLTGPGRPGRNDQDGLSTLAARGSGWTYADLLVNMLRQSWPLS